MNCIECTECLESAANYTCKTEFVKLEADSPHSTHSNVWMFECVECKCLEFTSNLTFLFETFASFIWTNASNSVESFKSKSKVSSWFKTFDTFLTFPWRTNVLNVSNALHQNCSLAADATYLTDSLYSYERTYRMCLISRIKMKSKQRIRHIYSSGFG